jgi:hypothetical protein
MLREMMIALAAISFVGAVVATSTADARGFGGGGFAGSSVLAAPGFALPSHRALASGPASPSAIASSSPDGALPSRPCRSASASAICRSLIAGELCHAQSTAGRMEFRDRSGIVGRDRDCVILMLPSFTGR